MGHQRLAAAALLLLCTGVRAFQTPHTQCRRRETALGVISVVPDVKKRMGDAMSVAGLTVYQQGVSSAMAESWTAPVSLNVGSAFIRGCRLSMCLYLCEKLFKLLRAPASKREVPVPIEAAALALLVNLGLEYSVAHCFDPLPSTLALSLGATPVETAVVYLTLIAWRIVYAAASARF